MRPIRSSLRAAFAAGMMAGAAWGRATRFAQPAPDWPDRWIVLSVWRVWWKSTACRALLVAMLTFRFTLPTTLMGPGGRCESDSLAVSNQWAQVARIKQIPCRPWNTAVWIKGRVPEVLLTLNPQRPGTVEWFTLPDTLGVCVLLVRAINLADTCACWSNPLLVIPR